ncbi:hypothetical protein PINS_up009673 [Pythium insidiosum]|nr:hypothetical protein PINS_up009673 [Pythium insidiosum]
MGAAASRVRPMGRPFAPSEFTVAWLTFKGDSVENTDHRYVAKKDGLVSSKLLHRLFGDSTMACFVEQDGEYISREMFICTLAMGYDGNTEDRISYIFTMYSIIYGLERESDGCIIKRDYTYLLEYLEAFNFIPKKFYAAFDECGVPSGGMLLTAQFLEWVRRYPVLIEFLSSHLPPSSASGSPPFVPAADDIPGSLDRLNYSPSFRLDRDKADSLFANTFDFIGGEDSGDDSDEAYDSDQLAEMEEFGAFQSAYPTSRFDGTGNDSSDRSDSEETLMDSIESSTSSTSEPLAGVADISGRGRNRGSRSRGVQKMGRNITKTLGGGISKVGRTILHGGKPHASPDASDSILAAGYAFSSESQISKNYVCGYLHKISDGKWSKRSWHRRWFVLDRQQGILSYYRHNPANHITSTPRGNIVHMEDENTVNQSEGAGTQPPTKRNSNGSNGTASKASVSPPGSTSSASTAQVASLPSSASSAVDKSSSPHNMIYLNKSHPWYRGELNLNQDNVSLLFEKSLARNAPTKYFFQVSTLALQEIDSKRGMQYKLCAENEEEFDRWTQAIAEAINRKHSDSVPAQPLSHQQLYRQRLLKEQQAKGTESLGSSIGVSDAPLSGIKTPPPSQSGASTAETNATSTPQSMPEKIPIRQSPSPAKPISTSCRIVHDVRLSTPVTPMALADYD